MLSGIFFLRLIQKQNGLLDTYKSVVKIVLKELHTRTCMQFCLHKVLQLRLSYLWSILQRFVSRVGQQSQ